MFLAESGGNLPPVGPQDGSGGGDGDGGRPGGKDVLDLADQPDDDDLDADLDEEILDAEAASPEAVGPAASSVEEVEEDDEEWEDDDEEGDDEEDDGQYADLDSDQFFCQDIVFKNFPQGEGLPLEEDMVAGLNVVPGQVCDKKHLKEDLDQLQNSGLFAGVTARVVASSPGSKRMRVEIRFAEEIYPPIKSLRVVSKKPGTPLLLPQEQLDRLQKEIVETGGEVGTAKVAALRNIIEGWYQKHGYVTSFIHDMPGLKTGNVTVEVTEGRVNGIKVVFMDAQGQPTGKPGITNEDWILDHVQIQKGQVYNASDGQRALRDVFAMGIFDSMQIMPGADQRDPTKVNVDVMVSERPRRTVDLDATWGITPNDAGRPTIASFVPGGTLTYEDNNMNGMGQSFMATVSTDNFASPGDDLSFQVDLRKPYLRGRRDPTQRARVFSAFNSRRTSGVFTPGDDGSEVPAILIDRVGLKAGIEENYSRNSKGSFNLVVQQVAAKDEQGGLQPFGVKQQGQALVQGPPTTLSNTGKDHVAFLQAALNRDTTHGLNGSPIGSRDSFLIEQGLGIGSGKPVFNRHTASLTRFLPLYKPEETSNLPPAVLVGHGRYSGCIGDLPSYEAFTLGGPNSVRAYSVGELATGRRLAELGAELRVPIPRINKQVFAFAEWGSDLGSSKAVRGNPTAFFLKPGSGACYGVGTRLGSLRAEYVHDNNANKWYPMLRYGERY
ncbi:hypothetical protein WJX73_008942 [Symbiochloris irregularis]|uniref:Uncharacterized protein n=1 Tax=Symbiochloris irregularis TaxID=706552 RepID=A0AAW1PM52_9CHLO